MSTDWLELSVEDFDKGKVHFEVDADSISNKLSRAFKKSFSGVVVHDCFDVQGCCSPSGVCDRIKGASPSFSYFGLFPIPRVVAATLYKVNIYKPMPMILIPLK